MVILSKSKIEEIKRELKDLEVSLKNENEEQALRGGPMDSFKEAAAFSVSKQAKEARVKSLNDILKNSQILPDFITGNKIVLGKWFKIKNKIGIKRYRLVDPVEADPRNGLISYKSPLGEIVINKTKNEKIQFNNEPLLIVEIE